jgi:hypothetical protein
MRRVEASLREQTPGAFLSKDMKSTACNFGDSSVAARITFERLQRFVNSRERRYHCARVNAEQAMRSTRQPTPLEELFPENCTPADQSEQP